MLPITRLKSLSIYTLLIFLSYRVSAQGFGDVLATGADNAEAYLKNYAAPGINAFGNGLANGWYSTARPHKVLGFNVSISPSFAFIPASEKSFAFNQRDYTDLVLEGDSDGLLPTIAGREAEVGAELVFTGEASYPGVAAISIPGEQRFDVPDGIIDLDDNLFAGAPAPTFNIGIGIPKATEIKLRVLPPISFGNFQMSMLGGGIMHDVKQWIPGLNNLPFDLSAFFGVSQLNMKYDIDVFVQNNEGLAFTTFEGEGKAIFKTTATTFQGVISKKIFFFTPFASLGFNAVNSNLDVNGDYTYTINGNESQIKDPISLNFDGTGGLRATLGVQVKLAVFIVDFSYAFQQYNTLTVGLGVSVR
ncbi:MAG: hypothetical protein JXR03_05700 [Cyclobacteriaceae bacterium]